MRNRAAISLTLLFLTMLAPALHSASSRASSPPIPNAKHPKLILVIVFDQFRADYLTRFESRFLPALGKDGKTGGFRYLMEKGAYFPFGQYDLLQSMTGPGHSTILSGSYTYLSGIPINFWFDPDTLQPVYCAEDASSPTVGATPKKSHVGTSPRNFNTTTVGDELKNADYPSKVVTVSMKDRAAILMGGHRADLALWLDSESFRWVSSRYYLHDGKLPEWIEDLNRHLAATKGTTRIFKTSKFTHESKVGDPESLATPLGMDMTVDAAKSAFDAFEMGKGDYTNLFAVSFSSHDYAGHKYGPNSPEMEEMTVADDLAVSQLLNFVRKRVPGGLANVTVVLTGDHGIPSSPEYLKEHGWDIPRVNEDELKNQVEAALELKFGKPPENEKWVPFNYDFNMFFNRRGIAKKGISLADVEAEAKSVVSRQPGVYYVLTSVDHDAHLLPPGMLERQTVHSYFPGRSGDLILIPKPFTIKGEDVADHLTGYSFDRTVPIAFAGFGIRPGVHSTRAEVVDIAPTLSFLTGTIPPATSEGRVLSEVLAGTQ